MSMISISVRLLQGFLILCSIKEMDLKTFRKIIPLRQKQYKNVEHILSKHLIMAVSAYFEKGKNVWTMNYVKMIGVMTVVINAI